MAPTHSTLMADVEAFIRRYVTLPDPDMALPLALWTLGTHLFTDFDAYPYLVITSATKQSGKTRLSEVLRFVAANPRAFAAMTAAALFRCIRDESPSLFVDESETLSSESAGTMRAVLNVGYRRGQTIPRTGVKGIEEWPVYCPKCFILIGDVYDTLRDRSIIVTMVRGKPAERFLYERAQSEGQELRDRLAAWAEDYRGAVRDAYENSQPLDFFTSDRDAEIWTPLFVLADTLGLPRERLTRIAVDLAGLKTADASRYVNLLGAEKAAEDAQYAERLLADLLTAIDGARFLYTADALVKLQALPASPWRVFRGTGLSEMDMANLLARFAVKPKLIREGSSNDPKSRVKRGYRRDDVHNALLKLEQGA